MSEVIAALSHALDAVGGQPAGHAVRTCVLGMYIGRTIRLKPDQMSSLFYALLLKDLGCSSNSSRVSHLFGSDDQEVKRDLKTTEWTSFAERARYVARNIASKGDWIDRVRHLGRVATAGPATMRTLIRVRCTRGAMLARELRLPEPAVQAIRHLEEHWDGSGHPDGLTTDTIPILARILSLAQTTEAFVARDGFDAALDMAQARSGTWFDPNLVQALVSLRGSDELRAALAPDAPQRVLLDLEPEDRIFIAHDPTLDRIASAFARVVDAKSPWSSSHSHAVAEIAVGIGTELGLSSDDLVVLRRAGLLHDIGKLGISSAILDNPGRLGDAELAALRRHPELTHSMLRRVSAFGAIADVAASHHERLDGKGYHRGLEGKDLSPLARTLAVADHYEALTAHRPYRRDFDRGEAMTILSKSVLNGGLCPHAFAALKSYVESSRVKRYQITA